MLPGPCQEVKRRDLSGLDRNLELLTQEIALRGSRLFGRTTSAACASAYVSREDGDSHFTAVNEVLLGEGERIVIRERTVKDEGEVRNSFSLTQFGIGVEQGEQGPGMRQYLLTRVAGTKVKNGEWKGRKEWRRFT